MNDDELQRIWKSPHNEPREQRQRQWTRGFIRKLQRARRLQALWLVWTFAALTGMTLLALWQALQGKLTAGLAIASAPLLIIPWGVGIHFLCRFQSSDNRALQSDLPLVDALNAALQANQNAQVRLKTIRLLLGSMLPILAISIWQLHVAGKVSGREAVSMAGLFLGALTVSGIAITLRILLGLKPQEKRLGNLIQACR
jgi:hypothetical protein